VLNDWKVRLLTDLYTRTMRHIAGDPSDTGDDLRFKTMRQQVRELVKASKEELPWWEKQIGALPHSYLNNCSPERIVSELEKLRHLAPDDAVAWGTYLSDQKAVKYTVGA